MKENKDTLPDRKSNDLEMTSERVGPETPPEVGDSVEIKNAYIGSTQQHPFSDPADARRWANIYEEARYEGRHRFDPSFQWDVPTEKRLIRKVIAHCSNPWPPC